jgi:hypothetical protein
MLQDLALALRLQVLDRKLASLESEIATVPKHIAEIEKKLEAHTRRLEHDRAALAANVRDRKKFDGDIQVHEQKISKLKGQMMEAKNNEQYRAFQNEISYAQAEIRKAEDGILGLMEASEPLDKSVKAAESELKTQKASVEAEKKQALAQVALRQKEQAETRAERQAAVAQMDPRIHAHYERIRKKTKGTVLAEAVGERCGACQITIRPQLLQDLRKGGEVMFCENCGRILLYNPVIDAAADAAASQQIA